MELKTSKLMFAILTFIAIASFVILLKPASLLRLELNNKLSASEPKKLSSRDLTRSLTISWVRKPTPEWKLPKEKKVIKKPIDITQIETAPVIIIPPKPTAPNPPFNFLGKMIDNEHSYVFLSEGANPIVVSKGDIIRKVWRVEKITPTFVELNYLPLDEIRQVFIK